jgi:CubicO group peptidase (beta-lactamase class C family)
MNGHKFAGRIWMAVFVLALSGLWVLFGLAGDAKASQAPSPSMGQIDLGDLSEHWDEFFRQEMDDFGVPGAVMVLVREGQVVFAKGYGVSDLAAQTPIDPEMTVLRAGSIAKTLTAVAVLQLAEEGRLDLDADVNLYLKGYQVPDTFPEPVTARHLINMTAGFDTHWVGVRADSAQAVWPFEEYIKERMPPRVLPPGRIRRYNDHEVALAGYLVEQVSGMPYEQYVREQIFDPLEMDSSSFLLPEAQLVDVARGYPVGGGPGEAYPLSDYYLNTAPGAGFNTTALDNGRYMIAHLQDGFFRRSDGTAARMLSAETARHMHENIFCYHPLLPGQANTFDEQVYNGHRYLRKLGGAPGMNNHMLLFLDQGVGFYLFYNSDGTGLRNDWTAEVLQMVFPGENGFDVPVLAASRPVAVGSRANYAGTYREVSDATSETTIVMLQALVSPDPWVQVQENSDGTLLIRGTRSVEIEPGVFQNTAKSGYTAFQVGEDGDAGYLFQSRTAYERVPWFETPSAQLAILGVALVLFLGGLASAVAGLLRGRDSGRLLAGLVSGLSLLFLVSLALVLMPLIVDNDVWSFSLEPSLALRLVLLIPILASFLALGLLIQTANAWRKGRYSRLVRVQNSLVLFGFAVFLYFLQTWNMLGWRF